MSQAPKSSAHDLEDIGNVPNTVHGLQTTADGTIHACPLGPWQRYHLGPIIPGMWVTVLEASTAVSNSIEQREAPLMFLNHESIVISVTDSSITSAHLKKLGEASSCGFWYHLAGISHIIIRLLEKKMGECGCWLPRHLASLMLALRDLRTVLSTSHTTRTVADATTSPNAISS